MRRCSPFVGLAIRYTGRKFSGRAPGCCRTERLCSLIVNGYCAICGEKTRSYEHLGRWTIQCEATMGAHESIARVRLGFIVQMGKTLAEHGVARGNWALSILWEHFAVCRINLGAQKGGGACRTPVYIPS